MNEPNDLPADFGNDPISRTMAPSATLSSDLYILKADADAQIAQVTARCNHLRTEYKTLELAGDELVKQRNFLKNERDQLAQKLSIEQLGAKQTTAELERLKSDHDGALRACAQMRARITNAHDRLLRGDTDEAVLTLLADYGPPSGEGWHSPEEWSALQAKCEEMRSVLEACDMYLAGACQPANRGIIKHALSNLPPTGLLDEKGGTKQ